MTVDVVTGDLGPQLLPDYDNDDVAEARDSLARLRETEATLVLTGHGEHWTEGVAAAVDRALKPRR